MPADVLLTDAKESIPKVPDGSFASRVAQAVRSHWIDEDSLIITRQFEYIDSDFLNKLFAGNRDSSYFTGFSCSSRAQSRYRFHIHAAQGVFKLSTGKYRYIKIHLGLAQEEKSQSMRAWRSELKINPEDPFTCFSPDYVTKPPLEDKGGKGVGEAKDWIAGIIGKDPGARILGMRVQEVTGVAEAGSFKLNYSHTFDFMTT
jgi:hypothetical protein